MVQSFGDGRSMEEEEPDPPFGVPRIPVMMAPVIDPAALEAAVGQVRVAFAEAARAGFADAMGEMFVVDDGTPEVPVEVSFDMNPTVDSRDGLAYQRYAARLDREVPGWWQVEAPGMAEELREQAAIRQAAGGRR